MEHTILKIVNSFQLIEGILKKKKKKEKKQKKLTVYIAHVYT